MADFLARSLLWLDEPQNVATTIQALAAVVTAVATFVLWMATRTLAIETKVLSRMTSNPFVVAHIEASQAAAEALHLILENTGNAAAFNVICKVSPGVGRPNETQNPSEQECEDHLIRVLPPGKKVPVATLLSFEKIDTLFDVSVSWTALPTDSHRQVINYKTSTLDAYNSMWGNPITKIAQSLETMSKALSKK